MEARLPPTPSNTSPEGASVTERGGQCPEGRLLNKFPREVCPEGRIFCPERRFFSRPRRTRYAKCVTQKKIHKSPEGPVPRKAVFFGPEGPETQKRLHETVPRYSKPLKVPRKATPHLSGAGFVCISARDHKGLSETHAGT